MWIAYLVTTGQILAHAATAAELAPLVGDDVIVEPGPDTIPADWPTC